MVASGKNLSDNRFWYFVMENAVWPLYDGYKMTLYGLVSANRILLTISDCVNLIMAWLG